MKNLSKFTTYPYYVDYHTVYHTVYYKNNQHKFNNTFTAEIMYKI